MQNVVSYYSQYYSYKIKPYCFFISKLNIGKAISEQTTPDTTS